MEENNHNKHNGIKKHKEFPQPNMRKKTSAQWNKQ